MPAISDFEREKSEVNAILDSGIFNRAPNLVQLLNYVCQKYFEGQAQNIKEYNLAVEALGRPPEFDQKTDSIVRVEAHRLRRRLREFYSGEGAGHAVQIIIPPGQYAPKFISRDPAPPEPGGSPSAEVVVIDESPKVDLVAPARWRQRLPRYIPWVLLAFCAVAVAAWSLARDFKAPVRTGAAISGIPPGTKEVRILAGAENGDYVDVFGRIWLADRFFEGGTVSRAADHGVLGAIDPTLYQNRREGSFSYAIPLQPGVYELRLHFAETLYGEGNPAGGGESSRVFNVLLNGATVLPDFDVIADAGANAADVRVFKNVGPAPDGKLHLKFEVYTNKPILNALEITPGTAGKMRPLRIIARNRGYTDKRGEYWTPDRYSRGGQLVDRDEPVAGTEDPELFRSERFGNLSYVIPVAAGRYAVTLYFAEAWFGPKKQIGGGVGSRLFDILCNGIPLARNFDIYKEAGGSNRSIARTFHNLEPNHQGKLVISLTPAKNYAAVNALEVVDESK